MVSFKATILAPSHALVTLLDGDASSRTYASGFSVDSSIIVRVFNSCEGISTVFSAGSTEASVTTTGRGAGLKTSLFIPLEYVSVVFSASFSSTSTTKNASSNSFSSSRTETKSRDGLVISIDSLTGTESGNCSSARSKDKNASLVLNAVKISKCPSVPNLLELK